MTSELETLSAFAPVPAGLVAIWALIGVVAAVIVVRLRDGDFGPRVGAALFAIGGVALCVLCASVRGRPPKRYAFVDEVVANAETLRAQRIPLQVHGFVVPGSIERRLGTDEYRFRMESRPDRPRAVLRVRYDGLVPDTFHSGAEIVATGTLVGDGGLDVVPDGIMAKCPSKYFAPLEPEWRPVEARP